MTSTQSGMGLMKCGNVVIPFDNTIEKGSDLYNLYNTNIHEKIAMEKTNMQLIMTDFQLRWQVIRRSKLCRKSNQSVYIPVYQHKM